MKNLLYLGLAVVVSVVGSVVLWLRSRQPRSMEAGIEQFARGLRALAPHPRDRRDQREAGPGQRRGE